jgi:hypothetical protein
MPAATTDDGISISYACAIEAPRELAVLIEAFQAGLGA